MNSARPHLANREGTHCATCGVQLTGRRSQAPCTDPEADYRDSLVSLDLRRLDVINAVALLLDDGLVVRGVGGSPSTMRSELVEVMRRARELFDRASDDHLAASLALQAHRRAKR